MSAETDNRIEVRLRNTELELVIHLAAPPSPDRVDGTVAAVRHYFKSRTGMKVRLNLAAA